ncbi:biofilm peroxide resistance protein BsmA [Pantoea stewartii]|uniref:Bioflm peroxide resistance protein BsmA n=2 Tax=Pantoea stewartii TaxID=66269 RepID=H3RHG5_PANSE|nr:biofilm peroxide resistance protein BsmA [Pantoea stewartii]KKW52437.1 biofilm stress and motility protein A [Pantoea ananatis]ARF51631.1 bioflm peroxide resistance protein BsmA [Pantoea stewartii subsp. stewartii DC283]EHT99136.1 putative lipoprotein [Pantoea stewartii subsp. stewartii DC283]KAB0556540.1 biofilm peroxide resistance protein BsmA [Pantoea stewartii subsp. stewartii]KHE00692.1 biofilm stress and motility protein A [Pantoea stewartii]
MRYVMLLTLSLLLSSCAAFQETPKAPPAPTAQAQSITRAQSYGLPKLGTISASVRGSPDDAERAIAARANQAGAVYYQILMVDETITPGIWYTTAILYGASPAAGARQ